MKVLFWVCCILKPISNQHPIFPVDYSRSGYYFLVSFVFYGPPLFSPGIAVDWVSSNLYWTDSDLGSIWVSRIDGSYITILLRNLTQPHGIAIDMQERYVAT